MMKHVPSYYAFLLIALLVSACAGRPGPAPAALPATADLPTAIVSVATEPPQPPASPAVSTSPVFEFRYPGTEWPVDSPEAHGLDLERLAGLLDAAPERVPGLLSMLVIRDGDLVLEKYYGQAGPETPREVYSVTKSFMSTLIGIAIDQGYIPGVEVYVQDYFPDWTFENPSPGKDALTLEHVLTMTTGLDWTESDEDIRDLYVSPDWSQYMLDLPVIEPPGERFNYCTGCSHLLAAIVEKATGMGVLDFARQHLFEPVGITRAEWLTNPGGTPIGGWGLQLAPTDMARLGYLHLREGAWDGRQVVSKEWVKTATTSHVQAEEKLGYGYQWWVRPSIEGYAAIGRDGQMVAVIPGEDLVVVFTSSSGDSEPLFGMIEDYILPAAR